MFNHFLMLCKNIKSCDINRTLKKAVFLCIIFFDNMKYKKRVKILLKVIERVYRNYPGMQTLIEEQS